MKVALMEEIFYNKDLMEGRDSIFLKIVINLSQTDREGTNDFSLYLHQNGVVDDTSGMWKHRDNSSYIPIFRRRNDIRKA